MNALNKESWRSDKEWSSHNKKNIYTVPESQTYDMFFGMI
jgi:hypothetical protein